MNPPQDKMKKEIERLKLIIEEIRVVSNHNYELAKSETLKQVFEEIDKEILSTQIRIDKGIAFDFERSKEDWLYKIQILKDLTQKLKELEMK